NDLDVCPSADRTGTADRTAPAATAALSVSGTHTFTQTGQDPIVGDGAQISVTLAGSADLDVAATIVQVGEIRLDHASGLTWTHTVASTDIDGRKALTVTLVDTAGNTAPANAGGQAVVVDLTAPDASCVLSPKVAK